MKTAPDTLDLAVQYARIRQILRDCRAVHLSADEVARIRLFYTDAGLHPRAHVPSRSMPVACDIGRGAVSLRSA
ncbi:MAG TPA: hypothetical protein VEC06_04080 [Paucimonas sp.]|nr:hypothetical protein [Paucimonas sp.]